VLLADARYTVVVKSERTALRSVTDSRRNYVDTDVECLRPFDRFLEDTFFCGLEARGACAPRSLAVHLVIHSLN